MPRMLDLCSGFGGASEAFVDAGWEVIRIDNNRAFSDPESDYYVPHTIHGDLLDTFHIEDAMNLDFIWASPPCYEFSNAFYAPRGIAAREGRLETYEPDMSMVLRIIRTIKLLKPKYWAIENVVGAKKHFNPILGGPALSMKPYYIWGNFPGTFVKDPNHTKAINGDKYRRHPLRANYRAIIPYWLSQQFVDGIDGQRSLMEWQ